MDFPFNVNEVLRAKFSVISSKNNCLNIYILRDDIHDHQDKDCSSVELDVATEDPVRTLRKGQTGLSTIIDVMGEKSAKAQCLRSPITSTTKLLNSDQRLYIMKDANANNGYGVVIGILKVGVKKLFMADHSGVQKEVYPISILDFYIHESKQRQGFGRSLFEVMLKVEQILPVQLAIDQPSVDLLEFLRKYYGLHSAVTQANNFAIYPGFFQKVKENTNGALGNKASRPHDLPAKTGTYIADEKDALSEYPSQSNYRYQKHVPPPSSAKGCLQWDNSPLEKSYSHHHNPQPVQNALSKYSNKHTSIPSTNLEYEGCRERSAQSQFTDKIHEAKYPVKQATIAQSQPPDKTHDAKTTVKHATHAQSFSTKIDTLAERKVQRKWDDMLSSWNVMGVLPKDYSYIKDNQHCKSFRHEFRNCSAKPL